MSKVYIRGSSIISALGTNKSEAISKISLNDTSYLQNNPKSTNFFFINKKFKTAHDKFYSILKQVVNNAISDAKLNTEEIKELHIFIASTSMSISVNEEKHLDFLNKKSTNELEEIGYGDIGVFVEDLIKSKYPSTIMQSACTSSANAFCFANTLIKNNKIKRAIVIGLELFNKASYLGFKSLLLLSSNKHFIPFDENSNGLILGEACSALILDSNKKSHNDFLCLSTNSSFDNHSLTNSNPNGDVSFECMKDVILKAKINLKDITCIKAHATGSKISNLSEINAINQLFEYYNHNTKIVVLKQFIGHTLGACGTNEIVLLCECINKGFLPNHMICEKHDNKTSFIFSKTNTKINKATVLFNFIGFGGSNTSIILSNEK